MNARPAFEPYRVILDYEALQEGFLDRIEDLNTTFTQIDDAGGMTRGNTQRLLTKNEGAKRKDRPSSSSKRTFGWESLAKELKATGLALVLVVDDERFAPLKAELMQRKRPRKPAMPGKHQPTWLFTKKKAREMGKKRFSVMTDSERKRHQRKAAKARSRKLSREERSAISLMGATARWRKAKSALAAQCMSPEFGKDGVAIVLNGNIQRPVAHELP